MSVFKGEEEAYELSLLPDLHGKNRAGWLNRLQCLGTVSGNKHVLSQRSTTLEWCCDCWGWRKPGKDGVRVCRHLRATGLLFLKPGDPPPADIIALIGEMRWYAQMANRFGEVKLAREE